MRLNKVDTSIISGALKYCIQTTGAYFKNLLTLKPRKHNHHDLPAHGELPLGLVRRAVQGRNRQMVVSGHGLLRDVRVLLQALHTHHGLLQGGSVPTV